MFDTDTFLQMQTEQSIDITYIPIPVGDYVGNITDLKVRQTKSAQTVLDIVWDLQDNLGIIKGATGRDKATVRQSIFLDFNEGGALDYSQGKNRQLGFLREAVGQNETGKPWSPAMLIGQSAVVQVSHRLDPNDAERIYEEVKKVTEL